MQQQMQAVPLAQQIAELRKQLAQLYVEGEDLQSKLDQNKLQRVAVRNVLAGIEYTLEALQKESAERAEAAKKVPVPEA